MQLEKNIGELLYCHDCVIVPEFGGFVANYRSAWIDDLRGTVHPPSKKIGFNRNLIRNDGLLVDHVAQVQKISFDEAGSLISGQVDLWNKQLENGERLELQGVGGLYFDKARNLHFDPDQNGNYLTASFGMSAVHLPPVVVQEKVETQPEAPILETESVVPVIQMEVSSIDEGPSEGSTKKVSFIPAAAATLVLLIAFGFWLNTRTHLIQDGIAQVSTLDPFERGLEALYKERDLKEIDVPEFDENKLERSDEISHFSYSFLEHKEVANGRVVEWNVPEPAVPISTHVETAAPEARYHVVGGCFSIERNAEGLITVLQAEGYDPKLIDKHKGLFRVSIGSYTSKQQALRALAAVRKEHTPSAWLLVK